jgi:hypothetical protein
MSLNRFAADENFHNAILRGLNRHSLKLDIVRIQDTEIYQADDKTVLEWVRTQDRILLTHDARTIPKYAYEMIQAGKKMPGVFVFRDSMAIGQAIEELRMTIEASEPSEWENIVLFFPL